MIVEMGRPKTKNLDLPPRMIRRKLKWKTHYYYVHRDGSRPALGDNLNAAKLKWAEIEVGENNQTLAYYFAVYKEQILPTKSPKTKQDQTTQLENLIKVFGMGSFEDMRPKHIKQYLNSRSAKIAANREMSLFSHFWNWAREEGHTDLPNPCLGVKRNKEAPRDKYVDDEEYQKLYACAVPELQDAMDLSYLTGQRPADVLKMKLSDIQGDYLIVRQNKTKKPLRIEISGELKEVITRIFNRPRNATGAYLVQDINGQPMTMWTRTNRFREARERAGVDFQYRDIRAKTASDIEGEFDAQKLLGHENIKTTRKHYRRLGEKVKPLK